MDVIQSVVMVYEKHIDEQGSLRAKKLAKFLGKATTWTKKTKSMTFPFHTLQHVSQTLVDTLTEWNHRLLSREIKFDQTWSSY